MGLCHPTCECGAPSPRLIFRATTSSQKHRASDCASAGEANVVLPPPPPLRETPCQTLPGAPFPELN